ncbi:metallophosphoesterase family protein [Chitinophaga horti]|uniref:Metallophosphoesterase family protein n=1 Tax=Chitinophaga horti TaxID=2920382 RepID=A0ABY6JBB8_9BACT|nr:metallophosphoesterase family protein [Chitinophaga horti]UYQ95872.1 metallophosphoesterase family protein [Chitinophaga horti]
MHNRRNFLGDIAKAGLIGLMPSTLKHEYVKAPAGIRFLTPPYLQCLTNDSVIIRWITDAPASSWVEYGESTTDRKALPEAELGLLAANTRVHQVVLKGLQPGTRYAYRVCSKQIVDFQPYLMTWGDTANSEVFHFTTPAIGAGEVSWIVLNDIHDRPASFAHLMQHNGKDPYDFVFLNGDMFDFQTDEQQLIDHLLTPVTSLFASQTPFMLARGNHETRGKYARQLPEYFNNPGNQYYFSFTRGPVHFIVLDTGEDKADDHAEYSQLVAFDDYRERQAHWLEQALQRPEFLKAPFRVVMMHIPVFHSGEGHGSMHCRQLFHPLFNKAGIDLMICGHTHRYGVHPADPATHHYPIVIGGGPKEGRRTLIKVTADRRKLQLRMLGDDGTEVGQYEVKATR